MADIVKKSHELVSKSNEVDTCKNTEINISAKKKEYTIVGDSLYAGIGADKAPQWLVNIIDTVVDGIIGGTVTDLDTAINSINTSLRELDIAKNQYQELINIDETINQVLTSKLETLNATLQQNSANIIELDNAKVTADEALAISIDHLNAQINNGDINALITDLQQVIANNEISAAQRIETLETTYNENESTVRTILSSSTGGYNTSDNVVNELLSDVELLQKQTDGIINTYANTHDVMLGIEDPNNDTDNDQLVTTAEPYASWLAEDTTNGNEDVRLAHVGDVYIKYNQNANGTKEYVGSFKFIKTVPDTTSPYSTDTEGFTWVSIIDQAAQDAYIQALNAYELADGKITNYYAVRSTTAPAIDKFWMDVSGTPILKDYINGVWTIITAQDGDMVKAIDLGDSSNNRDYTYSSGSWVEFREGGVFANASAITDLTAEVNNGTNTWATADSTLENSLTTKIENDTATVESKFEYNSLLNINGVSYSSGFGLVSSVTNTGTTPNPVVTGSEFWIRADRFRLVTANQSGAAKEPFSVDGVSGDITFNGKVSFNSVTDKDDVLLTGSAANDVNNGTTTIDGGSITANSITTNQLAANSVTTTEIDSYAISGKFITGSIFSTGRLDLYEEESLYVYSDFYFVVSGYTSKIPVKALNNGDYTIYDPNVHIDVEPVEENGIVVYYRHKVHPLVELVGTYDESGVYTTNEETLTHLIGSYKGYSSSQSFRSKTPSIFIDTSNVAELGDSDFPYVIADMYFGAVDLSPYAIYEFKIGAVSIVKIVARYTGNPSIGYGAYIDITVGGITDSIADYNGGFTFNAYSAHGISFRVYYNSSRVQLQIKPQNVKLEGIAEPGNFSFYYNGVANSSMYRMVKPRLTINNLD